MLLSDDVIFTQGAYEAFVNGTTSSRKASIVEPPAHDAVVEDSPVDSVAVEDTTPEEDAVSEPASEQSDGAAQLAEPTKEAQ